MNNTYLVPFFLGIFSGFLATLPVGPAKILAVRKFLLVTKGKEDEVSIVNSSNTILLASISGLIFAHLLFFLSLQFPFLYSLWVKPHFFSLFFLFVLLIYLYQIKNIQFDVYNTQPILNSGFDLSVQKAAFLETLLLQLLNPVLLPSPVFYRLTNVFLFRYSTMLPFFVGNFLGLLSGYGTFFFSTLFLLKKLELDAPTIYRLIKIKIHQFFVIVLFVFSFICLSRTPLPSIRFFKLKSVPSRYSLNKSWYEDFWPDSFFGYDRWKRPLRLLSFDNQKIQSNEEMKPFNKMVFSQFFFEGCLKEGKYSLYHNFPQNLSTVSQSMNYLLKGLQNSSQSNSFVYQENQDEIFVNHWMKEKKEYQTQLNQDIDTKISEIEKGISLEDIIEKRFSSIDENKNKISKQMDPRLSLDNLGRKFFFNNRSFLFLTKEYFSKQDSLFPIEKKDLTSKYTKNKFKLFLTENAQILSQSGIKEINTPFLTWKPLSEESDLINSLNEEEKVDSDSGEKIAISEKNFNNLEQAEVDDFADNVQEQIKEENTEFIQEEDTPKVTQLYKVMPVWNVHFNTKELNFLKRQTRTILDLNIFFPKSAIVKDRQNFVPPLMPFFRRNEFPGTLISRRGKAVGWNVFQKKPHAPFFVNQLNLLKNFFEKRKKIQITQDVTFRSWQPKSKLFQILRDYLLSLQAYIRKYIKLPSLIILKNLTRQLFLQNPEWEKDWTNLSKEVYVECDMYGKAISVGVKLPNFFYHNDIKQIKIVNPFQLRFWTRSILKEEVSQESENSSFLNVWGRETKMPFGKVKKSPSFWQLLIERVKLVLQYKILKSLSLSTKNQVIEQSQSPLVQPKKEIESKLQLKELETDEIKISGNKSLNTPIVQKPSRFEERKRKNRNHSTSLPELPRKQKIFRTRKWTNLNFSILLQRKWFKLYRSYLKKQKEFFLSLQIFKISVKKFFLQQNTKVRKTLIKVFSNIYRFIRLLSYQVSEFFSFGIFKITKNPKSTASNLNIADRNSSKNLSQAYIIHSIWEDTLINKPNISSLMEEWDKNHALKAKLETFLHKQGILGNNKPENFTEDQWKEWLKNFRGYTPSLKLWALWAPTYWTQTVEQYWKEIPSSKLNEILNKETKNINTNLVSLDSSTNETMSSLLESHLPLFQSAQKQKKLWKFNTISRNYTELGNEVDQNSSLIWETNDFDKKTRYLFDTLKKVKGKDKSFLTNPTKFSSSTFSENKSKISVSQQDIKKELPLIHREKKRLDFDIKVETVRQRATFSPISTRRWKLKKLKNKLEKLAKTVIKKPQGGAISSSFFISEKDKKVIKELFESENKLFANILENWNTKILDDELLMYNTLSSVLRFANKSTNISQIHNSDSFSLFSQGKSKDFDFYFVLLEDIYLPTHLREIRLLDCFDFAVENKNNKKGLTSQNHSEDQHSKKPEKSTYNSIISRWNTLLETNQTLLQDRQKIARFLWPRHRLEDLSCINRFWMGTANQSRFGMLRILTYPNG